LTLTNPPIMAYPSPWAAQVQAGEGGESVGADGAGSFAGGVPVVISPNRMLVAYAVTGFTAQLTGVYRNGQTILFPAFSLAAQPYVLAERFSGSVFQAVKPSAADSDVLWFTIPDAPLAPFP